MTNWTTEICKANGINVHYTRTGGDKPPVILLHGLMTKGTCWTPLARALENEYDVIMPDARGHGNSSAPDHGYRYDDLAADVLSLIDELRLTNPVLIGHSMGGMTAAVVASLNPKRLRGLVLADPTFLTPERQREVYESDLKLVEIFVQARFQTSIHAFDVLTPTNPDYMALINAIDVPSLLVIGDDGSGFP